MCAHTKASCWHACVYPPQTGYTNAELDSPLRMALIHKRRRIEREARSRQAVTDPTTLSTLPPPPTTPDIEPLWCVHVYKREGARNSTYSFLLASCYSFQNPAKASRSALQMRKTLNSIHRHVGDDDGGGQHGTCKST
eukprot:1161864-Pelagomonas_calceolata.AAC.13